MFAFLPSKKELIKISVLDRIAFIVGLRTFLISVRKNEIQKAIASMEVSLDYAISSVVAEAKKCDATTQEILKDELKRLWRYRNSNQEDVGKYLAESDADTRAFYLETRTEVEKILGEFAPPPSK